MYIYIYDTYTDIGHWHLYDHIYRRNRQRDDDEQLKNEYIPAKSQTYTCFSPSLSCFYDTHLYIYRYIDR